MLYKLLYLCCELSFVIAVFTLRSFTGKTVLCNTGRSLKKLNFLSCCFLFSSFVNKKMDTGHSQQHHRHHIISYFI